MLSSLVFISAAVASAMAVLVVSATKRWHKETEADMAALCDEVETRSSHDVKETTNLKGLPQPIQRHLQKSLGLASPNEAVRRIKMLSINQRGRFLLNGKWIDFTARQLFSASNANPGFVWEANMKLTMLSLFGRSLVTLPIHVKDAYVNGRCTMVGKLLGALTIVDMRDTPELNEGELSRWLGEYIVFPTALIPADSKSGQKLRWKESEDDDGNEETASATAVLEGAPCRTTDGTEHKGKTEIEFRCSKGTGLVHSIYAMRPYAEPGQKDVKMLPWEVSKQRIVFFVSVDTHFSLIYISLGFDISINQINCAGPLQRLSTPPGYPCTNENGGWMVERWGSRTLFPGRE